MIRILQVIGGMNYGGMESMLMNYLRNLDKEKVMFDFLTFTENENDYEEELLSMGSKIYKLTSRRKNPIKNYIQLNTFFKQHHEYKIVQIHQGITYFAPLLFAKKYKVPYRIVHSHGIDFKHRERYRFVYKLAKKIIEKNATNFFACSTSAANELFLPERIHQGNYYIMNNAILVDRFKFEDSVRQKIRTELNINDYTVFLNVGRISYQKNGLFLIDIFQRVLKGNNKAILLLIGEFAEVGYKKQIDEKIKQFGIQNNVRFLGPKSNINEYMFCADFLLMPSLFEGLPVVGIEAQTSGLKCIFSENITHEVKVTDNVQFASLDNVDEWIEKLKLEKIDRINAYKIVKESTFNIENSSKKLTKYYENLLN